MSSYLADIKTYWTGNGTLTNALPLSKVWFGIVPNNKAFPFAVITGLGSEPTFLTGTAYFESHSFQIKIYSDDMDEAESLADTVQGQFDYKAIAASTISCERTNRMPEAEDDTEQRAYSVLLEYVLRRNQTVGS